MAEMNADLARSILAGAGITKGEIDQLCHFYLKHQHPMTTNRDEALRESLVDALDTVSKFPHEARHVLLGRWLSRNADLLLAALAAPAPVAATAERCVVGAKGCPGPSRPLGCCVHCERLTAARRLDASTPAPSTAGEAVFNCRRCPVSVVSRWLEPECPECGDPCEVDPTAKPATPPSASSAEAGAVDEAMVKRFIVAFHVCRPPASYEDAVRIALTAALTQPEGRSDGR